MRIHTLVFLGVLLGPVSGLCAQKDLYRDDISFATEEIGRLSARLSSQKKIKWKKISRDFLKRSRKTRTDSEHARLLIELLAQLRDGHAALLPGSKAPKGIDAFPEMKACTGAAFFFCRTEEGLAVRNSWGSSRAAGVLPGMQLLSVNGVKTAQWLREGVTFLSESRSFSTPQHAEFHALGRGLVDHRGARWKLVLKDAEGRRKSKTITFKHHAEFSESLPGADDRIR